MGQWCQKLQTYNISHSCHACSLKMLKAHWIQKHSFNSFAISPLNYVYQISGQKLAQKAVVSCERHAILTLRAFIELPTDWELWTTYKGMDARWQLFFKPNLDTTHSQSHFLGILVEFISKLVFCLVKYLIDWMNGIVCCKKIIASIWQLFLKQMISWHASY